MHTHEKNINFESKKKHIYSLDLVLTLVKNNFAPKTKQSTPQM